MPSLETRLKCSHADRFIYAMRAVAKGEATDTQQRIAFAWIINVACRVDEPTHWPGDSHTTAYLEGRRSIAADMVRLIKARPGKEKDLQGNAGTDIS